MYLALWLFCGENVRTQCTYISFSSYIRYSSDVTYNSYVLHCDTSVILYAITQQYLPGHLQFSCTSKSSPDTRSNTTPTFARELYRHPDLALRRRFVQAGVVYCCNRSALSPEWPYRRLRLRPLLWCTSKWWPGSKRFFLHDRNSWYC